MKHNPRTTDWVWAGRHLITLLHLIKLSNITIQLLRLLLLLPLIIILIIMKKTPIANTPTTNTHKMCGTSGTLRMNHCAVMITNVLFPTKHFPNVSLQRLAQGHRTIYLHIALDQCHQLSSGLAGQFPGLPTCMEGFKATSHPPTCPIRAAGCSLCLIQSTIG